MSSVPCTASSACETNASRFSMYNLQRFLQSRPDPRALQGPLQKKAFPDTKQGKSQGSSPIDYAQRRANPELSNQASTALAFSTIAAKAAFSFTARSAR